MDSKEDRDLTLALYEQNKKRIFNELETVVIQDIDFGIESHENIVNMSVTIGGIRKEYKENEEKINTPFDPRMGATDHQCSYCYQKPGLCTGHFGHINFTNLGQEITQQTTDQEKMYVYVTTQTYNILYLASCICINLDCPAKIRTILFQDPQGNLSMEKVKKYNFKRTEFLKLLAEETKKAKTTCKVCNHEPGNYDKISMIKNFQMKRIKKTDKSDIKNLIADYPYEIFNIFDRISDIEAVHLNFYSNKVDGVPVLLVHPRNYIMRSIYVISPIHRPMIRSESRPPELHSFSRSYNEIIKILTNGKADQNSKILLLQTAVNVLYLNKENKGINNTQKQYTSVKSYLQGRDGMLRDEMLGKRVNYAGRTVIAPGPNVNFGEVGVPKKMAELLSVKETILQDNIVYYQTLFINGKINYHYPINGPHAGNKMEVNAKYIYNKKLEIGDQVDRQLQNGDIVVINRQPTLHKFSMMAARAVIISENVIRIPLCYTTMFCADFDGDEMNLHVPQTKEAIYEAENYMNISKNLISDQTSTPAYGQVLDTIVGSFLLTKAKNIPYDLLEKCNDALIVSKDLKKFKEKLSEKNVPLSDGKALFSLIFPDDFTYRYNSLTIVDGILTDGVIDKSSIGIGSNSLLVEIIKRYGQDVGSNFLTDNYKIIDIYNSYKGFSTGFGDIPLGSSQPFGLIKNIDDVLNDISKLEKIEKNLDDYKVALKSKNLIDSLTNFSNLDLPAKISLLHDMKKDFMTLEEYRLKKLDDLKDKIYGLDIPRKKNKTDIADYEKKVAGILNKTETYIKKFQESYLLPGNTLLAMTKSGAKGKDLNISNMIGNIGQQNFKGERLSATMHGNRVTPTDIFYDPDPESRGYCHRSLLEGLSPKEMFSHITASREGIIDIAIGISETGYTQRRMMKSFEDIKVDTRGAVINSKKKIIQFVYGEDGMSATSFRRVNVGSNSVLQPFDIKSIFESLNNSDDED